MHQDTDKLLEALEYQFNSADLLTSALTHRSYLSIRSTQNAGSQSRPIENFPTANNERLEFLGDAALGYLVAEMLYEEYPNASEHKLTLMRANLVRGTSLSGLAQDLGLGDYLFLGQGERSSGGASRASILANALEAVFGAILLDGGIDALRIVVIRLFRNRSKRLMDIPIQDFKSRLQELLQARGLSLPSYSIVETSGQPHAQVFTLSCRVEELGVSAQAQAASRKSAEKLAAEKVFNMLSSPEPK